MIARALRVDVPPDPIDDESRRIAPPFGPSSTEPTGSGSTMFWWIGTPAGSKSSACGTRPKPSTRSRWAPRLLVPGCGRSSVTILRSRSMRWPTSCDDVGHRSPTDLRFPVDRPAAWLLYLGALVQECIERGRMPRSPPARGSPLAPDLTCCDRYGCVSNRRPRGLCCGEPLASASLARLRAGQQARDRAGSTNGRTSRPPVLGGHPMSGMAPASVRFDATPPDPR